MVVILGPKSTFIFVLQLQVNLSSLEKDFCAFFISYHQISFTFQANVVCKQLKYKTAISYSCCSPRGPVPSNFSYDNVQCTGTEATLDACPHANTHDCFPNEGAWIVCSNETGH